MNRKGRPRHRWLVPGLVVGLGCATGPPPVPAGPVVEGWTQTGVASWYGPGFHGRQTASGEVYDMEAMTAAHQQLPFGTTLRVENLDNGRTTTVRVNDRGPFAKNRVLDVSRRAARELGMIQAGTARIRLTVIEVPVAHSCYEVQLGAYADARNAADARRRFRGTGEPIREAPGAGGLTRVIAGPYRSRDEAAAVARRYEGLVLTC